MFSEQLMEDYHDYDEKNKKSCLRCKEIYDEHGDTDAQIEDYHKIEITREKKGGKSKSRKSRKSRKSKKSRKSRRSKKSRRSRKSIH